MPTLKEIDDLIYLRAREIIESGEQHAPLLIAFLVPRKGRPLFRGHDIQNDETSSDIAAKIAEMLHDKRREAAAVVMIVEAWQVELAGEEAEAFARSGALARYHPQARLVLAVNYYFPDGSECLVSHPILRERTPPRLLRGEMNAGALLEPWQFEPRVLH